MLELELLFISNALATTIEALPCQATNPKEIMLTNYNNRVLHNILGTTVNALLNWLDTTCFTYEHAITFFHRPCPATLSFHYPLHRNFALILNAFLRRDSKLSSHGLCKVLFASIEKDMVKGDSRKRESTQEAKSKIGAQSKLGPK